MNELINNNQFVLLYACFSMGWFTAHVIRVVIDWIKGD